MIDYCLNNNDSKQENKRPQMQECMWEKGNLWSHVDISVNLCSGFRNQIPDS